MIRKDKMAGQKNSSKTVLVTGATSGIGAKIVIRFAENGWDVVCHYCSSEKKASELGRMIERYRVNSYFIKSDFLSKKQISALINRIEKFNIDSLINNAGTYFVNKHFSELTTEDVNNTFMVNTFAPILISSRLFIRMKERCFGRIVNISSIAAKYGGSNHSLHYGCSKLALEGITKTLAREGAWRNVLVNTIRPGVIDTDFHRRFPKDMKKRVAMIPLKKMGNPEDVADMAYYLGSEKNSFITNEIITIAGGE